MEESFLKSLAGGGAAGVVAIALLAAFWIFIKGKKPESGSKIMERLTVLLEKAEKREAEETNKLEDIHKIITSVTQDGIPRVWAPQAMLERTHEGVRKLQEAQHEMAMAMNAIAEAVKIYTKELQGMAMSLAKSGGKDVRGQ